MSDEFGDEAKPHPEQGNAALVDAQARFIKRGKKAKEDQFYSEHEKLAFMRQEIGMDFSS